MTLWALPIGSPGAGPGRRRGELVLSWGESQVRPDHTSWAPRTLTWPQRQRTGPGRWARYYRRCQHNWFLGLFC